MAIHSILTEISREMPEQCPNSDGFILTAYDCAVYEKELDDERFEYVAQNIYSGKSLILERRRNPITSATVERLLYKLRDSRIAGEGRIEISGKTPLPLSKIKAVMAELFHDILPEYGYVIRERQIELSEQLLDTIANRNVLLAEAAIGIGKTLVYVIVGALIKRSRINHSWSGSYYPGMSTVEWQRMPILISTSSIALQKSALICIKEVSKILTENGVIKTPLRVSLKKGRRNYICEHRLRSYLPFERNPEIAALLNRIIHQGDIDLTEIEGLTQHIKNTIAVSTKCFRNCPYKKGCRYMSIREVFDESEYDFIVTNHNLLLADANLRSEGKRTVLPPVQMYVIDEAHQLPLAARSIYGAELFKETIPTISTGLRALNFTPLKKKKRREWRDVRKAVNLLTEQLLSINTQLFSQTEADLNCDGYLRKIRTSSDYLVKVLKDSYKLKVHRDEQLKYKFIAELKQLSKTVTTLSHSDEQLLWFERDGNMNESEIISLNGLHKKLSEQIYNDLWKRGVPAFLTSGTLSASSGISGAGDFSAFKRSVGIKDSYRVIETVQPSPYDYRNNCLLYLSENVPFPKQSSKAYIEALTDEVERLIRAAHGHTAVLFTSYNVMGRVYSRLQKRGLPFPLFKLEKSTSNAIDRFKESGNGVLFASGALWEGIDIPGDALSMLIIVKLPFAVPDRISEYEQTHYSSFKEYLDCVLIPEMLVRLKQGFGRLIRAETDIGVVAILDCRVNSSGAYRDHALDALPECYVTGDIAYVEGFIKAKKPVEYFHIS